MEIKQLAFMLSKYFPGSFNEDMPTLKNPDTGLIVDRLLKLENEPIRPTHFNQLLHLVHEAGVSSGFFNYYFTTVPRLHPYPLEKVLTGLPDINESGISSPGQLDWGFRRFFIDGLLYFGNIRSAYKALHRKNYQELQEYFSQRRLPAETAGQREKVLQFNRIPVDDRYLIAEIACKAYSPISKGGKLMIEHLLIDAYKKQGKRRLRIGDLFCEGSPIEDDDPQNQLLLNFAADELRDEVIENEDQIHERIDSIYQRFEKARSLALKNTRLYLSLVNELDVYVATSMRTRDDFRFMARDCDYIFGRDELKFLRPRYFDPTMSASDGHEDKGLIECLMVKCCKALLYFAGAGDSFGKDSEVAMAMSLGKPVVILCPSDRKGEQRARFFRDTHPLSRLIHFDTGVACGAAVTQNRDHAAILLGRILNNGMEYDFEHDGHGYFRLRERLTKSVIRLQTNDQLLRETFWNYYRGFQLPKPS